MSSEISILVDADACPVKDEIYRVGLRHAVRIVVVSNDWLRVPDHPLVEQLTVSDKFDAADDAIHDRAGNASIVVTGDILLADRCLKAGSLVLSASGKPFTSDNIGGAIAMRAIMADLRADGSQRGGPSGFTKKDRSNFLQALDRSLVQLKRRID